ncbi:glycerol-3-phosphate dehydrogenase/oxidase [Microbacterium sp. CFBP9034]|uniref:glycerol-3-phosphate dehydrogenase/oxidase n=1 Tax=Microbacterium sp. CFBP9034 TaxID=3096540 RepID=UPI002A6A91A0|nr:glycerol-3-phosphate dehydrogenase/oxidase [Microbacterium sp. CFBP9034]MDY0909063.1 glycerol-3-phosphate dehydrogenase/oxidase [Microbacterium sp. CFBP9034]
MSPRIIGRTPRPSALHAGRRARELDALAVDPAIDVLVIGGGATGAGIALDAASRGLRTVLVERHDLAHGTSRWSSKLIHGGLRYLASGQVGIAHESAAERHLLMTRIAPHLTRPLAQVVPLYAPGHVVRGGYLGLGYGLGDGLRRFVGTPDAVLHAPGPIGREETLRLIPAVSAEGLRGGMRGWDGQLIDDARLVVAIARTAAGYGASVLTRVEAVSATGDGAVLRDALTGAEITVRARAVVSATGVWAGELDADVRLRPSRGTHLVVSAERLGGSDASLTVPVPGSSSRFVFTLPAQHGRAYIGLTDVPADGDLPDEPQATDAEIDMLLATVNTVLARPLQRSDVIATFAGLRPLLAGAGEGGETSDLSRRHAIIEGTSGVMSVVGGKLTTYRRMAEDAVDAVAARRFGPGVVPACRTRRLPLVGAWPRKGLAHIDAPARLVRRYGAEAPFAAGLPGGPAAACGVTAQELHWGVAVEGALTLGDLLDRRTRLGLVAADREASTDAAAAAFERAGVAPV